MASKTSKWADGDKDDEEAAAAIALRKKEKEERKRVKEEKARKAAAGATTHTEISTSQDLTNGDDPRPTKRQRTSESRDEGSAHEEGAHLLHFPSRAIRPCGHVSQYETLNSIEEGSYGLVSRARTKSSGAIVALKRLKMQSSETNEGFPVTGLREIQTLRSCRHDHVVQLLQVVMGDGLKE